jgi:hypothetical protein
MVNMPFEGGTVTVEVSSPVAFTHEATADWLAENYTVEGNIITLSLPQNPDYFARQADIDIEIPSLQLSTRITVEQLGDVEGLELARKFIGPAGVETAWYFDPTADNGPSFNGAWAFSSGYYDCNQLKIGRINSPLNPTGLFQGVWAEMEWRGSTSGTIHRVGYKIGMTEGETDYEIVFSYDYIAGTWPNDATYFNDAKLSTLLTNLAVGGEVDNPAKTYRVVRVDDVDNPTVMTLRDVDNLQNWFTVTKTPVNL